MLVSDYRNRIFNEEPIGVKDSVNVDFTTKFSFKGGTVRLYKNGYRITEGIDYTLGAKNEITLATAPIESDVLIADYDVVSL